ncbi:MAG: amidohydrolase [Candidatus Krumholzibacteria bacterium]|nr:amidohydrolase [Candidatus Krumholzibacteria bacterium]MDP6668613.1 amidohydrolase [Candidatus Krumholzibacteria bacterium]MDP6797651.1 amidohydrolase [Candidatus Krumholzibacteria bacterium]MDP7022303.1 amidohydrolase [Candidatus Krumholzibacteria bacterium]
MKLSEKDRKELRRLRRQIHRFPELGFQETMTAELVLDTLHNENIECRGEVGKTGVVAHIQGEKPGPLLLLRADMDALPIQEVAGRDYGSTHPGIMHACGHDGHTATLLVVLNYLQRNRETLHGSVRALFQPAEEGLGGAPAMIADGALENPRPDIAFGLHYWSQMPVGTVGVAAGAVMASVDEFHIKVKGKGGHAAAPHECVDPILASSALVCALQQIVSRRSDPLKAVALTVGKFQGGTSFNIIPEEVQLSGTVRCLDSDVWETIPGQIEEVIQGTLKAHACSYELEYLRTNIPLVNQEEACEQVRQVARDVVGEDRLLEGGKTLGGEDMADILKLVPGCYFFVGSGSGGFDAPHHHPSFDLDERALETGAEMLIGLTEKILSGSG